MARTRYPNKRSIAFPVALYQAIAQVAQWRGSTMAEVVRRSCLAETDREYTQHRQERPHETRDVLPGQHPMLPQGDTPAEGTP